MHKILANTVFLGKDIHYLTECHSTNDLAAEMVKSGKLAEGSIIYTENQTNGRGQRGNAWWSEPGKNLTFSLILQPHFLIPSEQFQLNVVISLAVLDVLSTYLLDIKVKWPNDIVQNSDGKLGGVLIENTIRHASIEYSIVGIGLNINQREFKFPRTTSMGLLSGQDWDCWEIFKLLVRAIEKRYIELKKGNANTQKKTYLANLFRMEAWHSYHDGVSFEGKITGINPEGKLMILDREGTFKEYGFKEIRFL
jgi:BirA family biotin operon repressor/biotin-[acetyl-CoA-carboxylase] ligase